MGQELIQLMQFFPYNVSFCPSNCKKKKRRWIIKYCSWSPSPNAHGLKLLFRIRLVEWMFLCICGWHLPTFASPQSTRPRFRNPGGWFLWLMKFYNTFSGRGGNVHVHSQRDWFLILEDGQWLNVLVNIMFRERRFILSSRFDPTIPYLNTLRSTNGKSTVLAVEVSVNMR